MPCHLSIDIALTIQIDLVGAERSIIESGIIAVEPFLRLLEKIDSQCFVRGRRRSWDVLARLGRLVVPLAKLLLKVFCQICIEHVFAEVSLILAFLCKRVDIFLVHVRI